MRSWRQNCTRVKRILCLFIALPSTPQEFKGKLQLSTQSSHHLLLSRLNQGWDDSFPLQIPARKDLFLSASEGLPWYKPLQSSYDLGSGSLYPAKCHLFPLGSQRKGIKRSLQASALQQEKPKVFHLLCIPVLHAVPSPSPTPDALGHLQKTW